LRNTRKSRRRTRLNGWWFPGCLAPLPAALALPRGRECLGLAIGLRLVVACSAILRGPFLPMASQAGSHVVVHEFLRGVDLCHVAVAGSAIHFRPNMRGVVELHEGVRLESVDTLPGNFLPLRYVGGNLLYLGLVGGSHGVTQHALGRGRQRSGWTNIRRAVTIQTLEPEREVLLGGIRDGLFGMKRRGQHYAR
jgi:hypothetical protein